MLPSNQHYRHPLREGVKNKQKKPLSLKCSVNVWFSRGYLVTILIHCGRSGRVYFLWALYDGQRGVELAHTEQQTQIRMEGRENRDAKKGIRTRRMPAKWVYMLGGEQIQDLSLLCSVTFSRSFLQGSCCNLDSLGWGGQDRKCTKLFHSIQTGRRKFCFKAFTRYIKEDFSSCYQHPNVSWQKLTVCAMRVEKCSQFGLNG